LADAIAGSFRQSRQSLKEVDFLEGVRLAGAVTEIVVTYRRTLVVDFSGKQQA
jgi:flavin-binding protein dodecin